MLLRFRIKRTGIITNIEKAFLQVRLHQRDRDVTKFLQLQNINEKVTENNIQVYRYARLSFGIVSSPFLLIATIEHHNDETHTATAKQIKGDIYVDSVIRGTNNDHETLQLYKEAKEFFQHISDSNWIPQLDCQRQHKSRGPDGRKSHQGT